jgi:positive regulator of sigma E activity
MTEECVVKSIKNQTAYISLAAQNKCGGCKACAFGRTNKVTIAALMDVECQEGDLVLVEMPQKDTSTFALLILFIPLLFLVIGFTVGGFFASIAARLISSSVFLVLSVPVCWLVDKFFKRKREYMPVIKKIIQKEQKYDRPKADKTS